MTLDVILATDILNPPLTGIGRYSYELAKRLAVNSRIRRLRYFSMGRWVSDPFSGLEHPAQERMTLRGRLVSNRLAVRAYQAITPTLYGWRLRGNKHAVYHSPNYVVPPFDGAAVSTVHDLSHVLHPQFHPPARIDFLNLAFGASMRRTDHVITDSEAVRQEFLERYDWAPENVTAIGLGVDSAYHPRSREDVEHVLSQWKLRYRGYSLYVGTIEPRKNLGRLLKAYGSLPLELRRNFPLVVAGSKGWSSEDIHQQMVIAQDEGWMHYLRFVDQAQLPLLYAGALLFTYPSLYEGFGLPLVEAMASGVPVLTSNTSCMPEITAGAARLADPMQVEDIAYQLRACLSDTQWQDSARAKGLVRAAQFSWDQCTEQTVGVYTRVRR